MKEFLGKKLRLRHYYCPLAETRQTIIPFDFPSFKCIRSKSFIQEHPSHPDDLTLSVFLTNMNN